MNAAPHIPVMVNEVIDVLAPRDGGKYVDGTFGAGGYSEALLKAAECQVYAIDRDETAIKTGAGLTDRYGGRLHLLLGRFSAMADLLSARGIEAVDGIALDLGISSMQIDTPERGFSFRADGPLDMRMEQEGQSAADVVNALPEKDLADIIYLFGEERRSRQVARAIVEARAEAPITRTKQLADVVARVVKPARDGIDPATRTFQALRIYVNDELGELARGLSAAEKVLKPGGRLAVVSFHSLEDRIIKKFLQERSGSGPKPSRHLPALDSEEPDPTFRMVFRGAKQPSDLEKAENPRSRSAKLRAAERTRSAPWPAPFDPGARAKLGRAA